MKCLHCQTENREEATFCRECGQSLQTEIVCSRCGHSNVALSRFCDKCGQPLTVPPPSTTVSPASTPAPQPLPVSFANGRYRVRKFLGEGGKKKVFLAHDTTLDSAEEDIEGLSHGG